MNIQDLKTKEEIEQFLAEEDIKLRAADEILEKLNKCWWWQKKRLLREYRAVVDSFSIFSPMDEDCAIFELIGRKLKNKKELDFTKN